jgi:allophanate hydrolase subunit 2
MGTGLPVVLMRDAGTNGGYPKLGAIIDADLDRLAQTRPGQSVQFTAIDVEDAHVLRRQYLARIHGLQKELGPLPA